MADTEDSDLDKKYIFIPYMIFPNESNDEEDNLPPIYLREPDEAPKDIPLTETTIGTRTYKQKTCQGTDLITQVW